MAEPEFYRVRITATAKTMLRKAGQRYGPKVYHILRDLIADLETSPRQKGKPLRTPLDGCYSRRHSRYRIVYVVHDAEAYVLTLAVGSREAGSRRDIYSVIERLIDAGALDARMLGEDLEH